MQYDHRNGIPLSYRSLTPLYQKAEDGLRKLLRQYAEGKYRQAKLFSAKFTAKKKGIITITYFFQTCEKGEKKRIFSEDVPFNYKAKLESKRKHFRPSTTIIVHGIPIYLNEQERIVHI